MRLSFFSPLEGYNFAFSLTLASLGWDVLATDKPDVINSVLSNNIANNTAVLPVDSGSISIRELDWTIAPDKWTWDDSKIIASASREAPASKTELDLDDALYRPPFDLIVTADTVYSPALAQPLLRTLHALCDASRSESTLRSRSPPVYVCIERRDSTLIDLTLEQARTLWGFTVTRIPYRKVSKAMERGGLQWAAEDWEGVEIWKLVLGRK